MDHLYTYITMRISEKEKEEWIKAAKKDNRSLSSALRNAMRNYAAEILKRKGTL